MSAGRLILAACVLGAGVAYAIGQVTPSQDGHALDANPMVGSGGLNLSRPATSFNSQLYVNQQVTGLGGFHGTVGYRPANELGLSLPSSGLRDFQRQSVGLQDVLSGSARTPVPFYDRSSTVLGVRDSSAGLTLPGSNMPIRSAIPPSLGQPGETTRYTPRSPVVFGPQSPAGAVQGLEAPSPLGSGSLNLFGRPQAPEAESVSDTCRFGPPLDTRIDAQVLPAPKETPERGTPTETIAENRRRALLEGSVPSNQDAYRDLLLRVRQREESQRPGKAPPETPEEAPAPAAPEKPGEAPVPAAPGKLGELVELTADNVIVIHGLAGQHKDAFNRYVAQGNQMLLEGKNDQAIDAFQLAILADERNPMGHLGRALAFFASDEPLSAALSLRRAFELYPPLMEARLDAQALMGVDAFRKCLEKLDQRLEKEGRTADPLLCLLAAHMHYSDGNGRLARLFARRLQNLAGPDETFLQAYATLLLTGRGSAAPSAGGPATTSPASLPPQTQP